MALKEMTKRQQPSYFLRPNEAISCSAPGVILRIFAAITSFSEELAFFSRFLIKPIFFLRLRRRRSSRSLSLPIVFPEPAGCRRADSSIR